MPAAQGDITTDSPLVVLSLPPYAASWRQRNLGPRTPSDTMSLTFQIYLTPGERAIELQQSDAGLSLQDAGPCQQMSWKTSWRQPCCSLGVYIQVLVCVRQERRR